MGGVCGVVAVVAAAGPASSSITACGAKKGGLMLAVTTDMRAPKDVSVVSLTISTNNAIKYNYIGRVTPEGEVKLPATLALAEPDDRNASVRIRIVAFQETRPRVLRDVRTSIPHGGRTALLRIPLNFVNDSSATGQLPDAFLPARNAPSASSEARVVAVDLDGAGARAEPVPVGAGEYDPYGVVVSSCGDPERTVIDGHCEDAYVDPESLPDYDEALVFGGRAEDGVCFDVARCLANASPFGQPEGADAAGRAPFSSAAFDVATCSAPLEGRDPSLLNVALVTRETGECVRPGECFVPLDREDGWRASGERITLSPGACKRVREGARVFGAAGPCGAKTASMPVCEARSAAVASPPSVAEDAGGGVDAEAGSSAPPDRVIEDGFVSTLARGGQTLLFAGESRVGRVDLAALPSRGEEIVALPAGQKKPWVFSAPSSFGPGLALTDGTSNAWVFAGGGTTTAAVVRFAALPRGVAFDGRSYVWAVAPGPTRQTPGGIYRSFDGSQDPQRVFLTPFDYQDATALLPFQTGAVLVGDPEGSIAPCYLDKGYCNVRTRIGDDAGRIDAIVAKAGSTSVGYALAQGGIYRGTGDLTSGQIAFSKVLASPVAALEDGSGAFRHALVANGTCAFFTSSDGVEWLRDDGAHGYAVRVSRADGTALGLVLAPDPARRVDALYWSLFAPTAAGGGVYRAQVPVECGGTPGGPDAGVTPADSGTIVTADAGHL